MINETSDRMASRELITARLLVIGFELPAGWAARREFFAPFDAAIGKVRRRRLQ